MAKQKVDPRIPKYNKLIVPTFVALKKLGGSGKNDEILSQIIKDLKLPDEVVDISHLGNINQSELAYRAAWARTYLTKAGIISSSSRAVWFINSDYASCESINEKDVVQAVRGGKKVSTVQPEDDTPDNNDVELPEEIRPWKVRLSEILQTMDPYAFERLAQRVLRDSGFTNVEVTKKSSDGGIDGTGKLKINGIFSFNVAFQCKRYSGLVGAPVIRDFRGSLTTDIEKGVVITTGTFSNAAKQEAKIPGKQQIDLIDGDEFINKIVEYGIGVKPVTIYEIDEDFFRKI